MDGPKANTYCELEQILPSCKIGYLWPFFAKNPQVEANVCWLRPSYGAHTYSCEIHPEHFLQIVIGI